MALVRDPRITDDHAGYGQVAHLRRDLPHPELGAAVGRPHRARSPRRSCPGGSACSRCRRNTASTAISPRRLGPELHQSRVQLQEATEFAGRLFKRLMYYTCAFPEEQLGRVQATLTAFEADIRATLPQLERVALLAYEAGDAEAARTLLTRESHARAAEALAIGRDLVAGIGAELQAAPRHPARPGRRGGINDGGPAGELPARCADPGPGPAGPAAED